MRAGLCPTQGGQRPPEERLTSLCNISGPWRALCLERQIRGHGAPENAGQAEVADEEKALMAYLSVRAAQLSPDGRRTFKDIANKLQP